MPVRIVHFYRVVDELGHELPTPFDSHTVATTLQSLDPQQGQAHHTTQDGHRLLGKVLDNPQTGPQFLSLYEIRMSDLPSVEQGGDISDLDLAVDAGLAEGIHACFFPNSVVGVMYNHYGPRANRLADYMSTKTNLAPRVIFQPLVRADVLDQLNDLERINLIDLKVPVSEVGLLQQTDYGLYSTLRSAEQLATSRSVVLSLGLDRQNEGVTQRIKHLVTSIVQSGRLGSFDRLRVRGRNQLTESSELLDILAERISVRAEVETTSEASRTVSDQSARQVIGDAYAQSEEAILQSIGDAGHD